MNRDDELTLRRWLEARDPGPVRAEVRHLVATVPLTQRPSRVPALDLTLHAGFGLAPIARPLVIGLALLVALAALVGALLLQPWRPFPPPGLLAYRAPSTTTGASGIALVAADGTGRRQVSSSTPNVYDHSPRWSRDGKTLLFARATDLDALSSCGGIGSVVAYDVASGTERVIATGLKPINVVEWSPSGDLAAWTYPPTGCGAQVELGVVDLRTGNVTSTVIVPQESEADPRLETAWHVDWLGEQPRAVPDAIVTVEAADFTTLVVVPSHAGRLAAHVSWTTPDRRTALGIVDTLTGTVVDLGDGGIPGWSSDDARVAYLEPGGPAGPNLVDYVRDHLVIATVATGERRTIADVLMPDGVPFGELPRVAWTSDGGAVYWIDGTGAHVVDVVTGRWADITAIPEACNELLWQPVPQV